MPTRVVIEDLVFERDDRIFLGEGLFETLKVSNAKASHAFLHWQRLSDAAKKLGICFDLSFEAWDMLLEEHINRVCIKEGGIKAILSAGSAPRGLTQQSEDSQIFFQTFQYKPNHNPLRLVRASWLRDQVNPLYQIKSVNYLEAILARKEVQAKGADDALFFNLKHHATETTCANFFIIKNNELLTPALTDGVLPGITRARIFSFCDQQKISCQEVALTQAKIMEADVVFITNSLQGIQRVLSFEGISFAQDHPLIDQLIQFIKP
jgi:4-amino-4-deoxychorismate lyase